MLAATDGGGDTIGPAAVGIRVRSGASAVISDDNDITGTLTAIHVLGSATIIDNDNSINGNGTGIDVDGGTALVQNNDLNGNTIGVLIHNGGVADLGPDGYDRFLRGDLPPTVPLRISPKFSTSHPAYAWLNRIHCLGVGEYRAASNAASYDVYAVK